MPSSDLAVEVWIDRPSGVYGQGEPVGIYVRPSEAAHVTVFNTNASGATTVVFPNQYQTQNRVAANKVLQLPGPGMQYQLQVGPPYGANLIKVLATKRPVSLLSAAEFAQSGAFRNFRGGPEALARQLNVVAAQAPDAGWANAELTFVSAPSAGANPAVTVLPAVPERPTSGNSGPRCAAGKGGRLRTPAGTASRRVCGWRGLDADGGRGARLLLDVGEYRRGRGSDRAGAEPLGERAGVDRRDGEVSAGNGQRGGVPGVGHGEAGLDRDLRCGAGEAGILGAVVRQEPRHDGRAGDQRGRRVAGGARAVARRRTGAHGGRLQRARGEIGMRAIKMKQVAATALRGGFPRRTWRRDQPSSRVAGRGVGWGGAAGAGPVEAGELQDGAHRCRRDGRRCRRRPQLDPTASQCRRSAAEDCGGSGSARRWKYASAPRRLVSFPCGRRTRKASWIVSSRNRYTPDGSEGVPVREGRTYCVGSDGRLTTEDGATVHAGTGKYRIVVREPVGQSALLLYWTTEVEQQPEAELAVDIDALDQSIKKRKRGSGKYRGAPPREALTFEFEIEPEPSF